jgi:LuxR family maltose regulon positive regulatory protein
MLFDLQTRLQAHDAMLKTHEPRRLLTCIDGLLAAFADSAAETVPSIKEGNLTRTQGLAEPLTRREGEVLGLIAKGYTNQEIAEALVVTLNTVKKHASGIYGKLGVHSRTQAVARAREFGLL